ncbi:MAG: methyltransferase domain-containing protein [Nitrospira sp.]|nr:methyltransferase domain-containing protein [Nitrospira sp.]
MHTKLYLLALCLLTAPVVVGQAEQHGQSHADHLERHFDAEESAQRFDEPARDAWQLPDQVIAALNLKRGQTVADIGAGTGYFTVRLAKTKASPRVYAADIEPSMVKYLRERAAKEGLDNVIAIQASPDGPNLPEPVDLILIVNTYHHIGDRETYFRRLAQSIRSGGQVAIIDFKPDSPVGPPKEFRFPPEQFRSEMGKAGYKVTAQHNFLPRQEFLIFEVASKPSPVVFFRDSHSTIPSLQIPLA